jgi:hypothetical protein
LVFANGPTSDDRRRCHLLWRTSPYPTDDETAPRELRESLYVRESCDFDQKALTSDNRSLSMVTGVAPKHQKERKQISISLLFNGAFRKNSMIYDHVKLHTKT